MKQKIYWFFPHLEQDGGGTKFLLEVTQRLTKQYRVSIICNTGKPEIIKSFRRKKVGVITTNRISANANFYWLFMPLFLLYDCIVYASQVKDADIIVSTMYPSNFIAHLCAKVFKKPHYHYCYEPFPYLHDHHFMDQQQGLKKYSMHLFALLYAWTDTVAVKAAKHIFTLNEITNRMIEKVYGRSAIITKMGVDTKHFRRYAHNPVLSKYASRLLIVHSTDYSQMKRTDLALEVMREIKIKFPNSLLLITSTYPNSPNKKNYEAMTKAFGLTNNVIFLNYIPYAHLPYYYAAASCYLSCSYDEMLGTTSSNLPVKEALACETMAIRAPVTTEDVIDGFSGYLIDPRKTQTVAKKLSTLLRDKKLTAKMGKNGRKTILANYSWDRVTTTIATHLM